MKRAVLLLALLGVLAIGGAVTWLCLRPVREVAPPASPESAIAAVVPVEEPSLAEPTLRLQPPIHGTEEIVGIGAILKVQPETGALMVSGAVPNSPAAAAGLAGEFLIRKIDGVPTEGMKLRECVDRIRGVAGSKVRLELSNVDASDSMTVELTRRKIQLQSPLPRSPAGIEESR